MKKEQDILKRLLVNEQFAPLSTNEIVELALIFINHVKEVKQLIADGKIKGDKGDSPKPDIDFLSKKTIQAILDKSVKDSEERNAKLLNMVIKDFEKNAKKRMAELKDGKDAEVTPELISQIAKKASELVEISEIKPDDIRKKLEQLTGTKRLSWKAIAGLEEQINQLENTIREVRNIKVKESKGDKTGGSLFRITSLIDVDVSGLTKNAQGKYVLGSGGGSSTFLDLTDTPSSYSGQALKFARVNAGETALEFATPSGSGNVSTTTIADNALVRGDGGTTDIQGSGITIDDSDNISGVGTLNSHTIPGGTGTFALTSDLSTYLENVVEDTTPQLGGDLDVNGNDIISAGSNDININPAIGRSLILNTSDFQIKNGPTISHRIFHNGPSYLGAGSGGIKRIGFGGVTSPQAKIHIAAGEATANGAPLMFSAGTNLTTPQAGAVEYDGTDLFFTDSGATRRTILHNGDIGSSVQAWDADLAGIAALTINANDLIVGDGANSFTTTTITTFGKSLIDDANASTARTTLGLAIGTDVQAFDALLDDIADLTDPGADRILFWDDSDSIMQWLSVGSNLRLTATTLDVQDYYLLNTGDVGTGVYDFGGATSFEIPNGAGGTTVDAAGEVTVDTTSGTLNFHDGTAERVLTPIQSKSITIESPTNAEDISMFYTDEAITITKIVAVLVGSSTPSVTWTLRHGTDRSGTGAEAVTSGTTTTSTTTGSVVTSFNDATVVADSFLWLETTAQSGTVDSINITVFYRQDA